MANNIGNTPAPIPTRLPDARLPNEQGRNANNDSKTGSGDPKLSANATGFFRLPDTQDQGSNTGGDANQGGGNGGGNTMLARAISGLTESGIYKVSKQVVDNLTGRTVAPTPEVGAIQDNLAGVSTYGDGTFRREDWNAKFASTQGRPIRISGDVPAAEAAQMRAARTEAQLNDGGPNPIIIARDRALGNG